MTKSISAASILMLTTALAAPALMGSAARAQTPPPPPATTATPGQPNDQQLETTPQDVQSNTPGASERATQPVEGPVEISGPGAGGGDDVIVIQGQYIPEPVRASSEVVNVLSAADIARSGDGDIGSALQRVTGLSLVGGRFVYVRGLGERYSLALLNGLPLPSPEPLRRVVPLDIFPTSVIASSVVQKSYSVAYPGEFGGGVINLTTPAIPEESFLTIGGAVGANSETTMSNGYTYFGSDLDFLGFDDGSRDVPGALSGLLDRGYGGRNANVSTAELQAATASLNNASTSLIQFNDDIPFNGAADISFGTAIDVGSDRLGIIGTVGWDNSWQTRGGNEQFVTGLSTTLDGGDALIAANGEDFRFLETNNRVVLNGLLGLAYEFGEHKIRWTNLYIRDTLKESRISIGTDAINVDPDRLLNRSRTSWFERQLFDTQVVAEFEFGDFSADFRGTYANTQRESPYERSFSYEFDESIQADFDPTGVPALVDLGYSDPVRVDGAWVNDLRSNGQNAFIAFSDLNEDIYAGAADFAYALPTARDITLSAGVAYSQTKRDSERLNFQYRSNQVLPSQIAQLRPDFLLSDYNVYNYGITLRENFEEVTRYDAQLDVLGVYGQIEIEPVDFVRAAIGVRYETAEQTVDTFDQDGGAGTGGAAQLVNTRLENDYFLPAATLTWNFAEDMQIRLAASKTIARPQFRELAPQQYLDNETNRTFIGNQFLEDSELFNAEARYEWYPSEDDRVSLAGFYKEIDNPIEAVALIQGQTFFTTFANAPKARLFGGEAEVQKYFPLYDWGLEGNVFDGRNLVLVANYTYTNSDVEVGADDQVRAVGSGELINASTYFIDGQPLVGQSDHLVNVQIGLEDEDSLSQQTLLVNYASDRITSRFSSINSDLERVAIPFYEEPGVQLDFVARQGFTIRGVALEAKFEARNLLGTQYKEIQTYEGSRIDRNVFDPGQTYTLGIGVNF